MSTPQKHWRQRAQKRLHELIVKHALLRTAAAEEAKLDRYQALLRYKPRPGELHRIEVSHWDIRLLRKRLTALTKYAQWNKPRAIRGPADPKQSAQ